MIVPSTNVLDFRELIDKNIMFFLYVDDNKPKQGGKPLKRDDFSEEGDLTIPVARVALGSEEAKYLAKTTKVAIKVSDESLNATSAVFKIDGLSDVTTAFGEKCAMNTPEEDPVE